MSGVWAEAYGEERGDAPPSQESHFCCCLFRFLLQATRLGCTNIGRCHICNLKEREVFQGLKSDVMAPVKAGNMAFVIQVWIRLLKPKAAASGGLFAIFIQHATAVFISKRVSLRICRDTSGVPEA